MEPRLPMNNGGIGGSQSSRNHRSSGDLGAYHIAHDSSNGGKMHVAGGAPPHLEHLHAAEVLASFQQYPIREATKSGASHTMPQTAFGNSSQSPHHQRQQRQHQHPPTDPLLHDMNAHSRDLDTTLLPILRTPEGAPGTDYDLNNCRGVTGIGGTMLPNAEPLPEQQAWQGQSYAASSALSVHSPSQSIPKPEPPSSTTTLESPVSEGKSAASKQENDGFKTTFQFIVNEGAKEARNTVRKHVMREYRRRERWEQGQKGPPEKKPVPPPTAKKRRRKQGNSPVEAEMPVVQDVKMFESLPEPPVVEQRRDSVVQMTVDSPHSTDSAGSSSGAGGRPPVARVAAPSKKKVKVLPPVFAESKQHQLWGAVATDYDDAIAELEGNKMVPYRADPWAGVAVNEIDPFSKLKLDLGPATSSLLHHFAWVMPSLMDEIVTGKVFHRLGWLYSAVAIHDPTPVHVILGYTLGHIASLRGIQEPALAIEHKSKAIKLLHARMADPSQCYSDDLIGAIVNLAGWELICANPKSFAMHMSGLLRIVKARGGMSAFQDNSELETVLVRLDAIRAYSAISAPRYPAFTSVRALDPLAINIPNRPRSLWSSNSTYSPFEYIYCQEALTLLNRLEDVLLLARSAATDLTGGVGEPFKKLLSSSLNQLLEKPDTHLATSSPPSQELDLYASLSSTSPTRPTALEEADIRRVHHAGKALRLAALAFLDAAIREFFDSPPRPGAYTNRLKLRFLGSRTLANDSPWGRSLEMLVAVLLQADRMALERPWRAWYVADALTQTMRIGEWTWDIVARALKEWVSNGGLDSDPELDSELEDLEKEAEREKEKRNGKSNGNARDIEREKQKKEEEKGVEYEKRSHSVWDLKLVVHKFLEEWGELPPEGTPDQGVGLGVSEMGMNNGNNDYSNGGREFNGRAYSGI